MPFQSHNATPEKSAMALGYNVLVSKLLRIYIGFSNTEVLMDFYVNNFI